MLHWLSQYMPDWFANFLISVVAASWGAGMRIAPLIAKGRLTLNLPVIVTEICTVFGMAIVAGPLGIYLKDAYHVDESATYALCVCFAYLGARVFDRISDWLEKNNEG